MAVLISDKFISNFTVKVVSDKIDGILGVSLECKSTKYCIVVYSCYLPPDGSPWADTSVFFTHLISQIYDNSSADLIIVGGDFNARIGNSQDFINYIDSIPLRIP